MSKASDFFISELSAQGIPIGGVIPWFGPPNTIPGEYQLLDGRELFILYAPELYDILGTTYGGDGVSTFRLPDLRGRIIPGLDNMGGVAAGVITSPNGSILGGTLGDETHTLTEAELPAHQHNIPGWANTDGTAVDKVTTKGNQTPNDVLTDPAGGGQPHNIIQPSMFVNWIMRVVSRFSGGTFEDTIQELGPSVYWRMDDLVSTGVVADYSGNNRTGLYDNTSRITTQQPSLVLSDSTTRSVRVASASYPTRASARDHANGTWWNAPAISFSICFKKDNTDTGTFGVHLLTRDLSSNPDRFISLRIRAGSGNFGALQFQAALPNGNWISLYSGSYDILNNQPHIVTCVSDQPNRRMETWLDNTLIASNYTSGGSAMQQPSDSQMVAGQGYNTGADSLNGFMSHMVFGQRAWSAAEIQALHVAWNGGE